MTDDPKDELRRLIAPDAGPGSMDEYLAVAAAGRILDAGWRPVPAEGTPEWFTMVERGVNATLDAVPYEGNPIAWRAEVARVALRAALNPSRSPTMADDLLTRLRATNSRGERRWYRNPDGPEAADEIERLRAELSDIGGVGYAHPKDAKTLHDEAVDRARAALAPAGSQEGR